MKKYYSELAISLDLTFINLSRKFRCFFFVFAFYFVYSVMLKRSVGLLVEQKPATSSALAKQIWKASVRSVRIESVWLDFGKQVQAQSPFLTPRDVATIIHSFARIKWKDEKLLTFLTPSILKHIDTFSVREIVHILSAFRKLEYARLDCIDLLMNQLVLKYSDWNGVDVALIANAAGWFQIFDQNLVWKRVFKYTMKNSRELSPLGISLIIGAMAKLDLRNEHVLSRLARQLVSGHTQGIFKQESFAVLVHGFYKLDWTRDFRLNTFFEDQLIGLLSMEESFFDQQSLCMILHAMVGYRLLGEPNWSDLQLEIIRKGFTEGLEKFSKLSTDQYRRMDEVCLICSRNKSLPPVVQRFRKEILRKQELASIKQRGHKLPRWEYEVYRILKDKMEVPVMKKNRNGRTDIHIKPNLKIGLNKEVCVLCLGPFQYYTDSTKRTSASRLNRALINTDLVIEIPFFIWNELKTDQDKIMYLYSQGRRVLSSATTREDTTVNDITDNEEYVMEQNVPRPDFDEEIEKIL